MKILTYLPTFNKNQRNLRQILVNADCTSIKCYRCGSFGKIGKRKNSFFICEKCGLVTNKHYNASNNISKRTIEYFKEHILSPILSC
jgi:transposase